MNKTNLILIRPLLLIFVAITGAIAGGRSWLLSQGVDPTVLLVGNLVIWFATLVSLLVLFKGERTTNPQVFIRSMYGSFLIRFFLILITAFIYIMTAKKDVNKPALMICAGLYVLYAGIEISILLRSLKSKKNA